MKEKTYIKYSTRILVLTLSIICIVSLTACGAGDVGGPGYSPSSVASEVEEKKDIKPVDQYEQNFDGFVQCLKDRTYIQGEPKIMSSQLIGAKRGYRYQYMYEKSNITVELYEYDINNINQTAQEVIDQVTNKKQFDIQKNTVNASLSINNTCLIIYNHSNNNEINQKRASEVENLLKEFKTL